MTLRTAKAVWNVRGIFGSGSLRRIVKLQYVDSNIARTNILQFTSVHGNIIMLFFLVSLFNFVGLVTDWQGRVHVVNTQKRYCD